MKILIVVDVQNDFTHDVLGTPEARAAVPFIKTKIEEAEANKDIIIFTRDTHFDNYLDTLEGQKLPVPHCIKNTHGWQVIPEVDRPDCLHVDKRTFGYTNWEITLTDVIDGKECDGIELCGFCTDICVISNALILRALYPNVKITVDPKACAGVAPVAHEAALMVMKSCQIDVKE